MPAALPLSVRFAHALLLAVGAALALPASTSADPTVSLSWNSCTGPTNRNAGEGTTQSLFVSASGLRTPVGGLAVRVLFGSPGGGLADAWRFDPAGCSAVTWRTVRASTSKSCPLISYGYPIVTSTFRYDTAGGRGIGIIDFAEAFTANAMPPASGPGLVVEFDFDQSAGTPGPGSTAQTCGCLDRPICIVLDSARYVDAAANVQLFNPGRFYATWNDPTGAATYCPTGPDLCNPDPCVVDSTCVAATPAHGTSWGHVKGMYRAPLR